MRLAFCFKTQAVNTSPGQYSITLYGEKLQGLTCLAHSSEKEVLHLMFSSLVILQESNLQFLTVLSNLCTLLPPLCGCFSALHPKLFSLTPRIASKERSIGSPFVFVSMSPHACCATPLNIGVLHEITDGVECDLDYCDYRWLLFSCELAWICLCEMNSQWLVYIYSYLGHRLTLGS